MEYATFGGTGATVSRIGFGGATLGLTNYVSAFDPEDPGDRARMFEAIEVALDGGINYYDTAPGYGNGASEQVLGEALQGVPTSGGQPLFVATKVGYGARGDVRASLEASLTRLRRDSVDLLQLHGESWTTQQTDDILSPRGMAEQLLSLKDEGLVKHIGFTTEDNNDSAYRMIASGVFDTIQVCYNLLFQHPYEPSRPFGAMLEADRHGLGIATMRTTTSGTFQRWVQLVNPANTFDYSSALVQFVLSNPYVDVALVGMRDADVVRANVALADDLDGRIGLDALHEKYVTPGQTGRAQ
ncbi:aldo/keto reductase [Actinopolymorpha sp. B17G11]|uniref:aldo/keto reductase n=1 Tax=Actinopolymorpha sp. B17G11 TaxID=3160861 RepID=UPI0032E3B303